MIDKRLVGGQTAGKVNIQQTNIRDTRIYKKKRRRPDRLTEDSWMD